MKPSAQRLSRGSLGALTLAFATAGVASVAHAGAFYVQEQSVQALGRAYSGEVTGQGADELWWNPAAIARSPREVYVGAQGLLLSTNVEDAGSTITRPGGLTTPVGGEPRSYGPVENGFVPNSAFSMPLGDRFAVGLSVAAPFNFITEYNPASWARYDTLKARVTTVDIQATGAFRATDWLDLGLGVDAQYTDVRLDEGYPNLSPLLPDAVSSLRGHNIDYGFIAGAQAHFASLSFGASYRSAIHHNLDGRLSLTGLLSPLSAFNMDVSANTRFVTPWIATLGGRWQATPKLDLDVQVQRFGWSEYNVIRVSYAGQTQAIPQLYKDTTNVAVGADYAVNPAWILRAGVQSDPTPTPDFLREAGVPDSDRVVSSVGTSVGVGHGVTVDAAFGYIYFSGGRISHDQAFYEGTPAQTVAHIHGVGVGNGKILSAGLRWAF